MYRQLCRLQLLVVPFAVIATLASSVAFPAACGPWELLDVPVASDRWGLTFGNDLFVSVGNGEILTSPDGLTWTVQLREDLLFDVEWDGEEFRAVGSQGVVLASDDGLAWGSQSFPGTLSLKAAAPSWVVIGTMSFGEIWRWAELEGWERRLTTSSASDPFDIIEAGGYVAVGDSGVVWTSAEGLYWAQHSAGVADLNGVAFSGQFVAVSEGTSVFTSPDAVSWTEHPYAVDAAMKAIAWVGDRFVAVGLDGRITGSATGELWIAENHGGPAHLQAVAGNGSAIVATGLDGTLWRSECAEPRAAFRADPAAAVVGAGFGLNDATRPAATSWQWELGDGDVSSDRHPVHVYTEAGVYDVELTADNAHGQSNTVQAITVSPAPLVCQPWRAAVSPTSEDLQAVTYGAGVFVAVGDDGVLLTSTDDGESWSLVPLVEFLSDVLWTGREFLAAGNSDTVFVSTDGDAWEPLDLPESLSVRSVAWNSERYTLVASTATGTGEVWTSRDGRLWAFRVGTVSSQGFGSDLVWNGAQLLAVGKTGLVLTSADGVLWKISSVGPSTTLDAVAWGNSQYVAVGETTSVFTSPDGQVWAQHPDALGGPYADLLWSGDRFVAVGDDGHVAESLGGIAWSEESLGTEHLNGLGWNGRTFVAVGQRGTIWLRDCAAAEPEPPELDVHVFYYPWYGNPTLDGGWVHWQQGGHLPPDDIGASFYPLFGPYSSADPDIVGQHMLALSRIGVGVAVSSWWGIGSREDALLQLVLDRAAEHGIEIAIQIEPYPGRTAASVAADIAHIESTYGDHPAFHRRSRPTRWGASQNARGVYYVFESSGGAGAIADSDWQVELDAIRGTESDGIVLGQTLDVGKIDAAHFDGLYNYDVLAVDGTEFEAIGEALRSLGAIFAPSVGPGYDDTRAVPGSDRQLSRDDGARYDLMWSRAIEAEGEWIGITSFNEWHEGSQIEPAVPKSIPGFQYLDYTGHYGCSTPRACALIYLQRTAFWTARNAERRTAGP